VFIKFKLFCYLKYEKDLLNPGEFAQIYGG
jgi:hypothetical protein